MLIETRGDDLISVRERLDYLIDFLIVFKIFDGKIACRVFVSDVGVSLQKHLYTVYTLFELGTVIDMDMSGQMRIALLVNLDYRIEKIVDTFSSSAYSRHHRHTEKITQLFDIQPITLCLKFIIHIKGHHNPKVHVDELGGEIQVALKIGSIYNIDDHIRHVFHKILPHIQLFRTVCGQRICARKVDDQELIPAVLECSFLRIHRDSAVVADMLVAAGRYVEKRCLSAVRVTYQGDLDGLSSLFGHERHLTLEVCLSLGIQSRKRLPLREHAFCL